MSSMMSSRVRESHRGSSGRAKNSTLKQAIPRTVTIYEVVEDKDVAFQLRPDHTLHHLCHLVCEHYLAGFRGIDNGVDAHLWDFRDMSSGERYERINDQTGDDIYTRLSDVPSSRVVGSQLRLTYDYGTTNHVLLRVRSVVRSSSLARACPRRFQDPQAMPRTFVHGPPDSLPTLDEKYPNLSQQLFGTGEGLGGPYQPSELYLFQPGRKNHQAYFFAQGLCVWLPEKFATLSDFFRAMEKACSVSPSGQLEWEERIMYPKEVPRAAGATRLDRLEAQGYSIFRVSAKSNQDDENYFAKSFPKCFKAYSSTKASERGWIHYRNGMLKVCKGHSNSPEKKSGVPECFQPRYAFEPNIEATVHKFQQTFDSLQDLFCAAEALWE